MISSMKQPELATTIEKTKNNFSPQSGEFESEPVSTRTEEEGRKSCGIKIVGIRNTNNVMLANEKQEQKKIKFSK